MKSDPIGAAGARSILFLLLFFMLAARIVRAQATLDRQLLVNPGAEAGAASPAGATVVPVPGWDTHGSNFTVGAYAPNGIVPDVQAHQIGGGNAFFSGGPNNAQSSASQRVDVSALASDIDAGGVQAILSGQLAGYGEEDDSGIVVANYLLANGTVLSAFLELGPQSGNYSHWKYYRAIGTVPPGARSVFVYMSAKRIYGAYNDAYFDNLSLVLTKTPPHPSQAVMAPAQTFRSGELVTNGGAEDGPGSDTGTEILPIPRWTTQGSFTVDNYGAPGTPFSFTAKLLGWGSRLFAGGPSAEASRAYQDIDLSGSAADIDASKLDLRFSVLLGAAGTGSTTARATVEERDGNGSPLLTIDTGPVLSPISSAASGTRVREAPLLPGARSARVTLFASPRDAPANDAYFDNVSLRLIDSIPVPAPIPSSVGPVPVSYGANLLSDPGAEDADPDFSDSSKVAPIPGWTTTGNFTAADYYSPAFLIAPEGERIGGGRFFFAGGPSSPFSTAAQTVDIGNFSDDVNRGRVRVHMEAQIGGFGAQGDSGRVVVSFLDSGLALLGALMLAPVSGTDPLGGSLAFESADGAIPAGTRSVQVMLVAQRLEGDYNDGYFDNLWLSLDRQAAAGLPGDLNGEGSVGLDDVTLILRATLGLYTLTPAQQDLADMNGDGAVTVADAVLLLRRVVGLQGPA